MSKKKSSSNHNKKNNNIHILIYIILAIVTIPTIYILYSTLTNTIYIHSSMESNLHACYMLKDANGTILSADAIIERMNIFLRSNDTHSNGIKKLSVMHKNDEDIYNYNKNSFNFSITTPKNINTAKSITASLTSVNKDNIDIFTQYCLGLMSIFSPMMKPDIRENVLYDMMGYTKNGDLNFVNENTYIIVETKYIFTYSKKRGLQLVVEQMPEPEQYSGDNPPM